MEENECKEELRDYLLGKINWKDRSHSECAIDLLGKYVVVRYMYIMMNISTTI